LRQNDAKGDFCEAFKKLESAACRRVIFFSVYDVAPGLFCRRIDTLAGFALG
jgi:hypothetical protein